MPCNFNQRELAQRVKAGVRDAGGTPMEFNTISVSDGVSMGTEGMRALAGQPRGDRRLDRARRPRPPARRPGLPGRLRQDDPRRGDGAGPARHARAGALQRLDRAGHVPAAATSPSRTSSRRSARTPAGKIDAEELHELEYGGLPGRGRLRRPVHRQHDGHGARVPGLSPGGHERRSRRSTGARATPPQAGRRAGHAAGARRRAARRDHHPRGARERRRLGRRHRRLAPTACCTCWRSPASPASRSRSTTSTAIAARTPIVAEPQAGRRVRRRPTSTTPAASRWSRAS